jgi:hypothetical protein
MGSCPYKRQRPPLVGKSWVEGFFTTVGGLVLMLQGADSAVAVSEYVKGILGGG